MTANLQNPIFTDETKAREWLEARVWPNGPVCPHCGSTGDDVTRLEGEKHRPGLYQCSACREQFTVTVKTVFERSKIPLSKWLAALFLLAASKKGISAQADMATTPHVRFSPNSGHAAALQRQGSPGRRRPAEQSGSLAKFTAMRRASSLVSRLAAARRLVVEIDNGRWDTVAR